MEGQVRKLTINSQGPDGQAKLYTFSISLLPLQANEVGKTRTEALDGRDFLVVPVVAVLETVLNGVLLPAKEILRFPEAWEGMPVPIGHPTVDDWYVSAKTRDQLVKCPGFFFDVQAVGESAKLIGDIWIDKDKAMALGGNAERAMTQLGNGHQTEVSTAFYADIEAVMGSFNGVEYFAIFRNIVPDHLAILLDEIGACNWEDGCGCPRTNTDKLSMRLDITVHIRGTARKPKYSDTETTSWGAVSKTFSSYRDGYYKHTGTAKPDDVPASVSAAPQAMKSWIASKSLLGDSGADNWRDLCFFPVVNPGTNKLNEGALMAVHGGRGQQADIPESSYESSDRQAVSLLNSEFDRDIDVNSSEGRQEMKDKWIKTLLACQNCGLSEEQLKAMPDEQLEAMAKMSECFGQTLEALQADQTPAPTPAPDQEPAPAPAPAPDQDDDDSLPEDVQAIVSVVKDIGGADGLKALLAKVQASGTQERQSLIDQIVANSDVKEADLEHVTIDGLKAMANALAPADSDFSGIALPKTHQEGTEELPMPDAWGD